MLQLFFDWLFFDPCIFRQLSPTFQLREVPLPKHLVRADRDAVRQVEASRGLVVEHGDPHAGAGILRKKRFGKPLIFPAEHEEDLIRVNRVAVALSGFCGEINKIFAGVFREKIVRSLIIGEIEQMPVIQTRSFELPVRYLEAHRLYDMEPRARQRAGP